MVLKLYGIPTSPNVRLVAAVLIEKDVQFELIEIDYSALKSPKYLELHPFGQVPCIVSETHVRPDHIYLSLFCLG